MSAWAESVGDWLATKVEAGDLTPDPVQERAAATLDTMLHRLRDYDPGSGFLGLFGRDDIPKGLYLWGGVGRGKSMLMDVFFRLAPVRSKQRVHFHAFMIDVHARIHAWRQLDRSGRRASPHHKRGDGDDPIPPVARSIAAEAQLLCFDEFHVTDITDAMILARLFEALWEEGVIVVATSNRAPEDLYRNGLNRALFEPFIAMMPDHLEIFDFDGEMDHRLRQLTAAPVYYAPLGPDTDLAMNAAWSRITGGAKMRATTLMISGRELTLEQTGSGAVRADFDRLCNRALGAADYLAIAATFHTLMLDNVPQMERDMRNQAKRFVALIDALYETRTKLVMSAEAEPAALYPDGDGAFEFERTVSRLMEMRSETYLAKARKLQSD
ncbi:cell division protein ZapE [Algimonas porphyrae]|uniref:Cell division protein ZapE n=1 Tax=Algimonas porphyrae TaxID=1128113 RepID=A0ABQ5V2N3_9PROT|nr:cell division protein ZapE [Algimonas porphyrae]GLQ21227.1 cell division protein ZapE [Algimonas porphyrae]